VTCSSAPSPARHPAADDAAADDQATTDAAAGPSAHDASVPPPKDTTVADTGDQGGADTETGTPDSGVPPGNNPLALESIDVPASGDAVTSTMKLDSGELFLLKAAGIVDLGGSQLDAEFAAGMDSVGAVDVGIDTGFKELILSGSGGAPPKMGPNRQKWFGAAQADHIYYMKVTGTGAPLSLKLIKPAGAMPGTGSISVAVFRLTPMAPALTTPKESVMVPFTKAMESSMLAPAAGTVYLLQAAGEAQVGGKGANGDAEFDDYNPDGTGSNEGEGGADFGICVDEGCIAKRVRKWGPYRKDHDYFMLYAGTGMPIKFTYCDTGYGDNAGGMTVKLFAMP
jgi:hypothetical protein